MKKLNLVLGATVAALVFSASVEASAPTLEGLLRDNPTVEIGDKAFSDWTLFSNDGGVLSGITVEGKNTDPMNPGLLFTAGQGALAGYGDLCFGFSVSVLNPGMAINGVSFSMSGDAEGDGYFGGIEDAFKAPVAPGDCPVYGGDVFDGLLLDSDFGLSDSAGFAPRSSIFVVKNLYWTDDDGWAEILSFEQHFKQTPIGAPEPGTLLLLGMGLAGLGFARKRRG